MKTTFQFPLVRAAVAIIAVLSAGASLSADEPAENAVQSEAEKAAKKTERRLQDLQVLYDVQYAQLATSAAAFIGVEVSPPDDVLRSHLGLTEGKGLVVTSVGGGGPAAQAGIQVNDVLTAVGGEEIDGVEKLRQLLEASKEKPVSVASIRAGQRQTVELTPRATAPAAQNHLKPDAVAQVEEPKYWLGVGLASADDALRSHLGIAVGEGLVVTGVENDSPAAKAGLMTNDLLLKLDGKPLKTIEELSTHLQEIKDKSVTLNLLRRGKPASLTVTAELRPQREWFVVEPVYFSDLRVANFSLDDNVGTLAASRLLEAARNQPEAQAVLTAQTSALLEQAKQLQAAIETLQATINLQSQPSKSEEPSK